MNRLGPEDYQSNRHIRKILQLARTSRGDIFYDLGCGRGQLCVVAVAEFGVKRAVGIEMHRGRAAKAAQRIQELGLADRIEIRNEDFIESDLHDATVVYSGLGEIDEDVMFFERQVRSGCRIVSLFLPFVGVLPAAADYPFYLMKVPFRKTRDFSLWSSKVLFKEASVDELYQELDTDREYRYDKRTFKRLMKERFPKM
ncbi:MAG: tRNA (adenine(22)-N(1))-methyltransferase TrmK [Thaumarchaeota archaeon]|nr:tRNA (adenine(22)-N(1))-methyltransferase TrmK [Nitrososphaerota archaeon]